MRDVFGSCVSGSIPVIRLLLSLACYRLDSSPRLKLLSEKGFLAR